MQQVRAITTGFLLTPIISLCAKSTFNELKLLTRLATCAFKLPIGVLLLRLMSPMLELEAAPPGTKARESARRTAAVHWQGVPLRDAVARLGTLFDDRVVIDRRIDPTSLISLDINAASAEAVLRALAAQQGLGVSRIDKLLYLGPPAAAEQLRTVAALRSDDIFHLREQLKSPLDRRRPVSWKRFAEPRLLVASLVEQRGWKLDNADTIPHDLWPAGGLPAVSFGDQLTVLLIGFDFTFELRPGDKTIHVMPLEGPVAIHRRYRLPENLADPAAILKQQLPDIEARIEDGVAAVDARLEEHERLAEWLRGQNTTRAARRKKTETRQLYTLRVQEKPVGAVIRELAQRLNWALEIDEASIRTAGISLDARVSFSVEDVEQNVLLEALLKPAGLDFRLEGERLRIVPRAAGQKNTTD
jgi:hypothetical protein